MVGEITSAFGIRGEVKLLPLLDDPKHLLKLPAVTFRWQRPVPAERLLKIVSLRRHQGSALLTVAEVPDRNIAETFTGAQVFVRRSELPHLAADTFYEADLVGCQVTTESGRDLGTVERVHFIPQANDVYETAVAMIPAVGDTIVAVDTAAKTILVRDIAGLRKDEV